jgi:hypothetical protein
VLFVLEQSRDRFAREPMRLIDALPPSVDQARQPAAAAGPENLFVIL